MCLEGAFVPAFGAVIGAFFAVDDRSGECTGSFFGGGGSRHGDGKSRQHGGEEEGRR